MSKAAYFLMKNVNTHKTIITKEYVVDLCADIIALKLIFIICAFF